MSVTIKAGTLTDFFTSIKQTAKQIDEGKKLIKKNTIWMDSVDLMHLLKPERTRLMQYLRSVNRIAFTDLMTAMHRSSTSLNNDLQILSKYNLVSVTKESNPGHGIHKIVESNLASEKIEFRVEI